MSPIQDSLEKISKLTGGRHEKVNPDFPNLMLLTTDGKNPERNYYLRDKMYREGKFRIYIGKMLKKGENIYSKIILENYIGELLNECRDKKDSFTIELCKSVGDVLNDDDQKNNTMTLQEQKDFLTEMIKKSYGSKALKKVNIICLDQQEEHKELLELIKSKGLKGLYCKVKPVLPNDKQNSDTKINSIDIARYLYRVCNQNDEFMKMIYETKSESLRNKEGNKFDRKRNSDFYGMIEIAIRITDFLNGIMIQGGVRRQEKYDKIIRFLLDYNLNKELDSFQRKNPKPQKYYNLYSSRIQKDEHEEKKLQEELELQKEKRDQEENKIKSKHRKIAHLNDLQDRLQNNKQWETQPFYSQHFDTSPDDNQELKEKKLDQKKIKNRISMIKYITAASIVLILGSVKTYDSYKQKKIEIQTTEVMKDIFKDKKVYEYSSSGMHSDEYKSEEAAEFIKKYYVDRLVLLYQTRYGKIKHMTQEEFRYKIISCLNNQKILTTLSDGDDRSLNLNLILDEIFIPQYIGEFKLNDMETSPYARYAKYEQGFVNILEADSSIFDDKIFTGETIMTYDPRINDYKKQKFFRVEPVGDFAVFNPNDMDGLDLYGNSTVYTLGLKTRYDESWSREIPYVVARGPFWIGEYKCEKAEESKRDLNLSKKVAINYFFQTKPVIVDILNEYIVRYKHFSGPVSDANSYISHQDMPIRNVRLWDSTIEMFIRDIVKNKIYEKIQPGEYEKIIKYIDDLVQKNQKTLIQDRENITPYSFYKENLSIIQRTLSNGYKLDKYWIDLPKDNNKYYTSSLGYYRTNNGKYYHVIQAKINGQEYIYASSLSDIYYEGQENSFGRDYGIEVAKDFMINHYPNIKSK